MAQFMGEVQGSRGAVHRLGGKESGMRTHCKGWGCGVRVIARTVDGVDVFKVYRTTGSGGNGSEVRIATIRNDSEEVLT